MSQEEIVAKRNSKREIFEWMSGLARSLGHPHRLELLEILAQGPRSVEKLAFAIDQSIANTSQHLQHLRRFGCVSTERQGKHIIYSIAEGPIQNAVAALSELAESNIAEVREIVRKDFSSLDNTEPVSRETLARKMRNESITILDVRPNDEFQAGHLPGAMNIPISELEDRLSELTKRKEIVAYCRGPFCVLSFQAAARLRAKGYKIRRMQDGFPEWKAEGRKVVQPRRTIVH